MDVLIWLIPVALTMGGAWLAVFMWALRSGQFDDPEGAASRILQEDTEDVNNG
ncbi:MAG: cbb3-type cytochrome oxidase assembly protein CcoS [Bdellovibrionales bacterium]|jgi:cbb3-type cytochrome oxidase maturation protein|nr:cbb3-type cytochrome oxidase assembly protein CcoS [Bdellovibrionales bacterium]